MNSGGTSRHATEDVVAEAVQGHLTCGKRHSRTLAQPRVGDAVCLERIEVTDLHHQRCHAGLAPLRMGLATRNESYFAGPERVADAVASRHPAVAREGEEELPEARFVRPDLASRLEVEDIGVSFAVAFGKLDRRRRLDLIWSRPDPFRGL